MTEAATTVHVPILVKPIVEALLEPLRAGVFGFDGRELWIVDGTLGGGGHASELLSAIESDPVLARLPIRILGVDQDDAALERVRRRLGAAIESGRLVVLHSRFSEIASGLEGKRVVGMLVDLGFSSDQIEDPARGLSFRLEGPLDMRLDPARGESCLEWLRHADEREIADVIYKYGEDRLSRRIASRLVHLREKGELPETTTALADAVRGAFPPAQRHGRIHPATRTFQAFRIHVNAELQEVERFLSEVVPKLERGGRVAVLTFHSLEDRIVKHFFRDKAHGLHPLTKKPVEADDQEVERNPRSRSAKLRVAEKSVPEA